MLQEGLAEVQQLCMLLQREQDVERLPSAQFRQQQYPAVQVSRLLTILPKYRCACLLPAACCLCS